MYHRIVNSYREYIIVSAIANNDPLRIFRRAFALFRTRNEL